MHFNITLNNYIFPRTCYLTCLKSNLIMETLFKGIFFGIPIDPKIHATPPSLLLSPTLFIAVPYQEHSKAMKMHRSHSNPVLDGCLKVIYQCLSIEPFPVKKPRWSSLPAQPVFGGLFCLSRNIHQISDCLHMFINSAGHQGSPSACERKQPLLSRRGRDKSKAVAKVLD
jgi:hypothetical protein